VATLVDTMNSRSAQLFALLEGKGEESRSVRTEQLLELKHFVDRTCARASQRRPDAQVKWLLAGDLNIEGGSAEYDAMVEQWGGFQALGAPDFDFTYNTESFLTPPGCRNIENDRILRINIPFSINFFCFFFNFRDRVVRH
jgi:hypothetical protein